MCLSPPIEYNDFVFFSLFHACFKDLSHISDFACNAALLFCIIFKTHLKKKNVT